MSSVISDEGVLNLVLRSTLLFIEQEGIFIVPCAMIRDLITRSNMKGLADSYDKPGVPRTCSNPDPGILQGETTAIRSVLTIKLCNCNNRMENYQIYLKQSSPFALGRGISPNF